MANITNLRAINNPQYSYMWEVEVQGLSTGGLDALAAYAKTVSIPQSAVEQIIVNHKGGKTHYAGRDASAHTTTITFWDDEALTIYKYFQDWMNLMNDQATATGAARDLYRSNLIIKLKDNTDANETGTITLSNAFPMDLAEVALSYDTSEAIEVSVTFSYDEKLIAY